MKKNKSNSPLLGYNTNVRHDGILFHIQTEDSGVDRPHIITHLFTEGTILATKKTGYADLVGTQDLEERVRVLMKQQHRDMFVELRDGVHDDTASRIIGRSIGKGKRPTPPPIPAAARVSVTGPKDDEKRRGSRGPAPVPVEKSAGSPQDCGVRVIVPSTSVKAIPSKSRAKPEASPKKAPAARSIFDTPDENGEFGEELISDKSLDEVILSYLTEEDLD